MDCESDYSDAVRALMTRSDTLRASWRALSVVNAEHSDRGCTFYNSSYRSQTWKLYRDGNFKAPHVGQIYISSIHTYIHYFVLI